MTIQNSRIRFSLTLLATVTLASAQPQIVPLPSPVPSLLAAASALPADHHDVYAAYFQYHAAWMKWAFSNPINHGSSGTINQLFRDYAKSVNVDVKELTAINNAAGNAVYQLNGLAGQRADYLKARPNPDKHYLNQMEIRRQQIIASAVRDLGQKLTPSGWHSLHSYINHDFRVLGKALPLVGAN